MLLYVCVCVVLKLLYVEVIAWKLLYVIVCMLYVVTEAAGGGGGEGEARDTESKTRTPHKDVGNKKAIMLHPDIKTFSCSTIFLYL